MSVVPLREALTPERYGGKAVALGIALAADLPVPDGVALSVDTVEAIVAGDRDALDSVATAVTRLGSPRVAVRSSAVGEDSHNASFAGMHESCLGVDVSQGLAASIGRVHASAHAPAAMAYRGRLGLPGPPRVGVAIQRMLDPDCAGVMFTRDPRDGSDQRVIEGTWGLGEAVVAGMVTPDQAVLARGGEVVLSACGHKDVAVRLVDGGTATVPLDADLAGRTCLTPTRLRALEALAVACERAFAGAHDIEWAFVGEQIFLLQRRPITT